MVLHSLGKPPASTCSRVCCEVPLSRLWPGSRAMTRPARGSGTRVGGALEALGAVVACGGDGAGSDGDGAAVVGLAVTDGLDPGLDVATGARTWASVPPVRSATTPADVTPSSTAAAADRKSVV